MTNEASVNLTGATDSFGRGLDIKLGEMERERGVKSNFHKQ